jgi:hypothetical protein
MDVLMVILRIIHIFAGVFWVGVAFFNIGFLQPAVRATGAEGQAVMRHLAQRTNFLLATYSAATLTMLSGVLMYWRFAAVAPGAVWSRYGIALGIGGIAGIIAWAFVIVVVRGIFNQMGALGAAIRSQGGPPTPEQAAQLQALGARLSQLGLWGLVFLTVALLGMSVASYI